MKIPSEIENTFQSHTPSKPNIHPRVKKLDKTWTTIARGGRRVVVGWLAEVDGEETLAYWCEKREERDLYNKTKGYSIDQEYIHEAEELGVERVFIGIVEDKSVLEFTLEQYLNGIEPIPRQPQYNVPIEEAVDIYPNALDEFVLKS